MARQDFFGGMRSTQGASGDGNGSSSRQAVPAKMIEMFLPGYSIISDTLMELLGIDITLLVSIAAIFFAVTTASRYIFDFFYRHFMKWCVSSITINSEDSIYLHVMAWIADQKITKESRDLIAVSPTGSVWTGGDDEVDDYDADDSTIFNSSHWEAKNPPRYEPTYGRHWFYYKGRAFLFYREKKELQRPSWSAPSAGDERETVRLSCIGRSTTPLKALLETAKDRYLDKQKTMTIIRRPADSKTRHYHHNPWQRSACRPSRPMNTVVLDHAEKQRLIADVNEYLHPSTTKWYANRGIPYRRG
jgi:mitochondrial chaperone BCS1